MDAQDPLPIDLQTLQDAQRPLKDRIAEFLAGNPGKAFNDYEVYAGIERFAPEAAAALALLVMVSERLPARYEECRAALEALAAEGEIEKAVFRGASHYYARTG